MKKITFVVMAMFLSMAFYPTTSNASVTKEAAKSTMVVTPTAETAETKALLTRLDQIDKMDKSDLKGSEKQALRKGVRSIKKQLHETGQYVYVSVGAILLIVILLIVLL